MSHLLGKKEDERAVKICRTQCGNVKILLLRFCEQKFREINLYTYSYYLISRNIFRNSVSVFFFFLHCKIVVGGRFRNLSCKEKRTPSEEIDEEENEKSY